MTQENSNSDFEPGKDSNSFVDSEWLNPLAVLDLRDAVFNQQTSVMMNGREFSITYQDIQIDDHGIMTGRVFVKLIGAFGPCASLGINTLLNYEFESDHDKHL